MTERLGKLVRAVGMLMVLLVSVQVALAVEPDEILKDPALEARARALSAELRCVVCQNQSIDDSNAPLARDLRLLVRERLIAGDSDADVRRFVVDRYGTFVLLKPPFDGRTLLLWMTPLVILIGAGFFLFRWSRRPAVDASSQAAIALTPDEEKRLKSLLAEADTSLRDP